MVGVRTGKEKRRMSSFLRNEIGTRVWRKMLRRRRCVKQGKGRCEFRKMQDVKVLYTKYSQSVKEARLVPLE